MRARICPYDRWPLAADEPAYICTECGVPHHPECWDANGGMCATRGCGSHDYEVTGARLPVRTAPRRICPYCRSSLGTTEVVYTCSRCHIPHHPECWSANGGMCATRGCGGHHHDMAEPEPAPPTAPQYARPRTLWYWVGHVAAALALVYLLPFLVCGVASWVFDRSSRGGGIAPAVLPSEWEGEAYGGGDGNLRLRLTKQGANGALEARFYWRRPSGNQATQLMRGRYDARRGRIQLDSVAFLEQHGPWLPDNLKGTLAALERGRWKMSGEGWSQGRKWGTWFMVSVTTNAGTGPGQTPQAPNQPLKGRVVPVRVGYDAAMRRIDNHSEGYSILCPEGWGVRNSLHDDGARRRTEFVAPDGSAKVAVDTQQAPVGSDPLGDWRAIHNRYQRACGDRYGLVELRRVQLSGQPAARWEFRLERDGERWRKIDVGTHYHARAIAVLVQAREEEFEQFRPLFERIIDSFRLE